MVVIAILAAALFLAQAPTQAQPPEKTPGKAPEKAPEKILALTGAVVHTMVPGAAPAVATVVVQGSRILSVGASAPIPEGAQRIELSGKHLIPGLIDGMVNHDPDHDRLYVTSGVTLVRDIGNDVARIFAERDKGESTRARDRGPGPAILCAGAILDGSPPATTTAIVLDSPAAAEQKIPRLIDLEPDFLSFYSGLQEPVLRKVIELGHARGLQVWGVKPARVPFAEAAAAGQDGVYHLEAFLPEGPEGKGWPEATLDGLRPAIETAVLNKVAVTPTLSVFAARLVAAPERPPELAYLGPIYVKSWLTDAGMRQKLMEEDKSFLPVGLRVVEIQGKLVQALCERGVPILPGSASPNPWLFPGKALVDELGLLARAGIAKPAVLALATSGAAKLLGVEKDRGTIEAGKIADLVAVAGDPTEDLAALRSPEAVWVRGRMLDRAAMEGLRKDLAETQKRLQGEAFKPLPVADPKVPAGDVLLRGTTETRAHDERISGESYAVVRAEDKSLVYASRAVLPGSASSTPSEVETEQTIRDGALVAFEVRIRSGGRAVDLKGTTAGGSLNIERRIDGTFQGTTPVKDRLTFLDTGSITAVIALGQRTVEGKLKVLFFEDLEPAVAIWEMHVDKAGTLLAKTQSGALKARLAADGSVEELQREEGNTITTTRPLSSQAGKGGLPVPEKKKE